MIIVDPYIIDINPNYDPTQILLDQGTSDGFTLPSVLNQNALRRFINRLIAEGIWQRIDVLYIWATSGDENFATYNIKKPSIFQAQLTNPTFIQNVGFQGNSVDAFILSPYIPSVDGSAYQLNNASMSIYYNDIADADNDGTQAVGSIRINHNNNIGSQSDFIYNVNGSNRSVIFNITDGMVTINRENNNSVNYFRNGVVQDTDASNNSNNVPEQEIYTLAVRSNTQTLQFNSSTQSLLMLGGDMTDKAAEFNNAFNEYLSQAFNLEAETQAAIDQANIDGFVIPSTDVIAALNELILDLKIAGVWNLIDIVYMLSTDGSEGFSRYNLKNPGGSFDLTSPINSPTYLLLDGFRGGGNGSDQYLDTNWIPSTDGVNYTNDSAHGSHYFLENALESTAIDYGVESISTSSGSLRRFQGASSIPGVSEGAYLSVNSRSFIIPPPTGTPLDFGFQHQQTNTVDLVLYENGVQTGRQNPDNNNGLTIDQTVTLLAFNRRNSTPTNESDGRLGWFSAGAELPNLEVQYNEAIQKYYDTINTLKDDPATTALLNQATLDGYTQPSEYVVGALDRLIRELKFYGVWDRLDALWITATDGDRDFAKYNLKDPSQFNLTEVNAPTFTALEGFTGNGSTSYLNTNFNLSTDSTNFQLSDGSHGHFVTDEGTIFANNGVQTGATTNRTLISIPPDGVVNDPNGSVNDGNTAFSGGANIPDTRGFHFVNIDSTNATNIEYYYDGALYDTRPRTAQAIPNLDYYIFCRNGNGVAEAFQDQRYGASFIGGNLKNQAQDFYNVLNTYMRLIGATVK